MTATVSHLWLRREAKRSRRYLEAIPAENRGPAAKLLTQTDGWALFQEHRGHQDED